MSPYNQMVEYTLQSGQCCSLVVRKSGFCASLITRKTALCICMSIPSTGSNGKFEVDGKTGEVRIVGRQQFEVEAQYYLAISAIPIGVIEDVSMTPVQVLMVQVDDVPPQFYMEPRYDVYMSERTSVNDE